MILNYETGPFLSREDESVEAALRKISMNKKGIVFVVSEDLKLLGALTDGDFRRWLVDAESPSLDSPVGDIANRACHWLDQKAVRGKRMTDDGKIYGFFPVLDEQRRVVAIAQRRTREFFIGQREVSSDSPCFIVAEIGINHNGSLDEARRLIDAAVLAGADCAKFQLRDFESLYRPSDQGFGEDLGAQYTLDLIEETQLSVDDTLAALNYVREVGLIPLCTPWDHKSMEVLLDFGVPAFKVASADLTNHPLVAELTETGRPLILSTGMSTEVEIVETVAVLERGQSHYALLHCNSAYPAPFKDLNLAYMSRLSELGDCLVGYSGHERGHHIAIAAVARGAKIIEKHITNNRNGRGNDHRVSLEPHEFRSMVSAIRDVEEAIGTAQPRDITQGESLNRLALGKSLVARCKLERGHIVQAGDIEVRSPGRGLQPNRLDQLLGTLLRRDLEPGDFFFQSDLGTAHSAARRYSFGRRWGLPVRFHDWRNLAEQSNPDFLEFHLSYRDLDVEFQQVIDKDMPYGLVVHSPDLFGDDLILDLASSEDQVFYASIRALQRVINLTRDMVPQFAQNEPPLVVASLGGSTLERHVPVTDRGQMYERVGQALGQLDLRDVRLIAQTLPPYPWYLGGQRFCNLFVDPDELVSFATEMEISLCFDVAHTKLTTNSLNISFSEATRKLLPHSLHLHLVDAAGTDNEGLQIFDGEIDWGHLGQQMAELAPMASFIPEIWQGHVDNGTGFWTALSRLEGII